MVLFDYHFLVIFRAICDIQGGPKYEIKLQGEASLIEYRFSKAVIMYGKQVSVYGFAYFST